AGDLRESLRVRNGKWPQDDRVDQRVDARVRADAERERQDRDRGEGRRAAQGAEPVPDVAEEGVEPAHHVRVARLLTLERRVAELAPREHPRVLLAVPLRAQLLDALIHMKGDLALDVARERLGAAG